MAGLNPEFTILTNTNKFGLVCFVFINKEKENSAPNNVAPLLVSGHLNGDGERL